MTPSEGCTLREARKRDALLAGGFFRRVDMRSGPESCWPWLGRRQTGGGYGTLTVNRKVVYVHRRVLELALGRALEPGEVAMHDCDNPPCCNPVHIRLGTKADNSADMARKGRGTHSLTAAQVLAIRAARAAGQSIRALAREYRVAQGTIQHIDRRLTWRHL